MSSRKLRQSSKVEQKDSLHHFVDLPVHPAIFLTYLIKTVAENLAGLVRLQRIIGVHLDSEGSPLAEFRSAALSARPSLQRSPWSSKSVADRKLSCKIDHTDPVAARGYYNFETGAEPSHTL